jgi:hypothetical protein
MSQTRTLAVLALAAGIAASAQAQRRMPVYARRVAHHRAAAIASLVARCRGRRGAK